MRIGFGVLGLVAVVGGPVRGYGVAGYSLPNEFGYFTIQSNALGVGVLLLGGLLDPLGRRWQLVRGASTLYLVITGIVDAALATHLETGVEPSWIGDVLHRVMPIVMIVDWVFVPVVLGVSGKLIAGWLVYPIVYCAYTLVRGPMVNWYPYPFIDPRGQGYLSMTIGLVVLAVAFTLLALAIAALGDMSKRWQTSDELIG
ncbi:Pr6Pr family membrane protein [Nocardia australiensis]|uniref:Pr6Pr family membrane protein n=1 Tax=Nocardia australiensis TaxID=2887191 RepID=UPI001D1380F9|nr:Pr6Pr family membrane protein [Nocardia australiensis]